MSEGILAFVLFVGMLFSTICFVIWCDYKYGSKSNTPRRTNKSDGTWRSSSTSLVVDTTMIPPPVDEPPPAPPLPSDKT